MVASSSLTQDVAGSNPFTVITYMFLSLNFLNIVKTFREHSYVYTLFSPNFVLFV